MIRHTATQPVPDPAEHYVGQAVIAAAVAYYDAVSDEDVDQAIDNLNAAVAQYKQVTAGLTYAHRLLDEAVAR